MSSVFSSIAHFNPATRGDGLKAKNSNRSECADGSQLPTYMDT